MTMAQRSNYEAAVSMVFHLGSAWNHINHMSSGALIITHDLYSPQLWMCSIYQGCPCLRHMSTHTLVSLHDGELLVYPPSLGHFLLMVFDLRLWSTPSHARACARYHIPCHFLAHTLILIVLHCVLLAGHEELMFADLLVLPGTSQCHCEYKSSMRSQGWVVPRWACPFHNKL